jgi:hypothetical protein
MQIIHAAEAWLAAVQSNPTPSGVVLLCATAAVVGFVLGVLAAVPVLGTLAWGLRR